jgi:hypothetical protein
MKSRRTTAHATSSGYSIRCICPAGKVVMGREDVIDAFRKVVAETSGFAHLTDKDAKHVVSRISAFDPDRRLVHTSGYVMGLPLELVSRFNRKEYQAFVAQVMQATMGVIQTVLEACARLVWDATRLFREGVRPENKSIAHVFAKTLNLSMITRINAFGSDEEFRSRIARRGIAPGHARVNDTDTPK